MKKTFARIAYYACPVFYLAAIAEVLIGIIWTKTEWATYVVRDTSFNWWGPGNALIGVVLLIIGYKLDQYWFKHQS